MKKWTAIPVILIAVGIALCAGCTGTDSSSATPAATAQTTAAAATMTAEPTMNSDLIPGPTNLPEDKYQVGVGVDKDAVYGTISVEFRGGMGQNFVNSIMVDCYYAEGGHETKELSADRVGDTVTFDGGQKTQDRIKVTVTYDGSIGSYVIYDSLIPHKEIIPMTK
ncbi:hypothetical protein [Methanoplanus endosymbiosus]|uniref:Uncharacterized protein n=1 Tax=Methanoplanus endosymbiosus TaxID=33865 RepID=A0A9E7TH39_9EURY|nr:hypothetical protein [Methanoplanus endosymbiosus]UUX92172.1 hypothetical protein L6E24_12555 [Methanoplanus endosymbiosus]